MASGAEARPGERRSRCHLEPRLAGEMLRYANPADPFALHKAALVLRGVVPPDADPKLPLADLLADRGRAAIEHRTNIPFGSGLGTSSILAGAVLAALFELGSGRGGEQRSGRAEESGSTSAPARSAPPLSFSTRCCAWNRC